MARLLVLLSLLAAAVAFQAPRATPLAARQVSVAAHKDARVEFDAAAIAKVAVLAPVFAAAPASAFSADYLPAILVPVMTLFLPAMGMALGFLLVTKEDL